MSDFQRGLIDLLDIEFYQIGGGEKIKRGGGGETPTKTFLSLVGPKTDVGGVCTTCLAIYFCDFI